MPKLWAQTIENHRREVVDAICAATAELVHQHGLRAVTMSQVAERAGVGRATLYKYFPDVDAILRTWHERQIDDHLHQLAEVRDKATGAHARLAAVLRAYALIAHQSGRHGDTEVAALLHRGEHLVQAQRHLHELIRDLLTEAVGSGDLRDDIPAGELANYCLHALAAAGDAPSAAAVHRLVEITLAGLQPTR